MDARAPESDCIVEWVEGRLCVCYPNTGAVSIGLRTSCSSPRRVLPEWICCDRHGMACILCTTNQSSPTLASSLSSVTLAHLKKTGKNASVRLRKLAEAPSPAPSGSGCVTEDSGEVGAEKSRSQRAEHVVEIDERIEGEHIKEQDVFAGVDLKYDQAANGRCSVGYLSPACNLYM